jgi:hypothetical protein
MIWGHDLGTGMEMLEREAKQATAGIREDWSGDLERMGRF